MDEEDETYYYPYHSRIGRAEKGKKPQPKPNQKPPDPCRNQRLDELSTPPRRMFLALWTEYGHCLPKDKVKNLKLLLQRLYAMTPEETEQYFAELRAEAKQAAKRRKVKKKLRKYLETKQEEKQKERAYDLFEKLLKCGMSYAAQNPIPPVVSIRLRYLSDIILEQICTLRNVTMPDRDNPDKLGQFLISVSDWMAIAVERLYFAAQKTIQQLSNENPTGEEDSTQVPPTYEDMGNPLANSTPEKHPNNQTFEVPKTYSNMSNPAANSTPKKQSLNTENKTVPGTLTEMGQPQAFSTPKKRFSNTQNQTVPGTLNEMGQPQAFSTPKKRSLNTQNQTTPGTLNEMGSPQAFSTPRKLSINEQNQTVPGTQDTTTTKVPSTYSGFGQPDAESTPDNIALYPYYSLLLEEFYKREVKNYPKNSEEKKPKPPKPQVKRVNEVFHYKQTVLPPCTSSRKVEKTKPQGTGRDKKSSEKNKGGSGKTKGTSGKNKESDDLNNPALALQIRKLRDCQSLRAETLELLNRK